MLEARRYLDLDACVLRASCLVADQLKRSQCKSIDDLLAGLESQIGDVANFQLPLAINFLFLIGLVEYDEALDKIILCKSAEEL